MGLFASKTEKTLIKCKKKELALQIRYLDGHQNHPSKIIRVDRDKFLIEGFAETLRQDILEVTVKELGVEFACKVTHKTHDIRGGLLYYCSFPENILPIHKHVDRFFVYPRAIALISLETLEEMMGDREEIKQLKMYVWDIFLEGLDLVNAKGRSFEIGRCFVASKVQVGKVESLVGLEVTGETEKEHGKASIRIINCKFTSKIENIDELMAHCKRIDSM